MASDLRNEDMSEVLSFLPPYEGKLVLEIGAGIGHFTGELAKKAGKVIVLDFIENVVVKNQSINGHHENVEFICGDVTSADFNLAAESVDLIISNWVFMHLSNKEVEDIAKRLLKLLKVGGYIFFREMCSSDSEDHQQENNTFREPKFYTKIFKECHISDTSGKSFELSLVRSKSLGTYKLDTENGFQTV